MLEAGRPDYLWDVFINMPAALQFPIGSRFYDWGYSWEPEPHMHGRRIYHARGKHFSAGQPDGLRRDGLLLLFAALARAPGASYDR